MKVMFSRAAFCFALLLLALPASPAEKTLRRPPGTTRYATLTVQLKSLTARGGGRMSLTSIGTSVKGRTLWLATVQLPQVFPVPKRTILYICRLHGHEPASTEGALAFLTQLVNAQPGSALAETLSHVTVYVVPMANPDGSEAFLRYNAHAKDLNRDWRTRTQPEIRALYKTIMRLRPDIITDQHELYPDDTRPDFTEAVSFGSGAPDKVSAFCDDNQAVVGAWMAAQGVPIVNHWVDDTHPARLTHRFGGVILGIPTLLFETNRLTGTGRSVGARAHAHTVFMTAVLKLGAGERDIMLSDAAVKGFLPQPKTATPTVPEAVP